MKKWIKGLEMSLLAAASLGLTACSSDDDGGGDPATRISGDYEGTLAVMDVAQVDFRAYVTLSRKSATAVTCKVECEELGLDLEEIVLDITQENSLYRLSSISSKSIRGSVAGSTLSLTFKAVDYPFNFTGTRQ